MGEVAGADDADSLLAAPDREMFQVAVPARRAGVLGVDVKIGVEAHAGDSFAIRRGRSGRDRNAASPKRAP